MNKPEFIIVHHTGGTDANPLADTSHHTFKIVDDYHKSLGWGGIGYHYFIELDGKITQGRKDTEEGAHTIGYNKKSIGICLAGNFDTTLPSPAQITALTALLKEKMVQYSIQSEKILPHRHFASKTCYGRRLADNWARNLVTKSSTKPNSQIISEIEEHIAQISTLLSQLS